MDYTEVKRLVMEELYRTLQDLRDSKRCPKCGGVVTMLKVYVEDVKSEEELAEDLVKWRCLNCLGLFGEELKEVEQI